MNHSGKLILRTFNDVRPCELRPYCSHGNALSKPGQDMAGKTEEPEQKWSIDYRQSSPDYCVMGLRFLFLMAHFLFIIVQCT